VLWYKAWLETRGRFLACLFGITIVIGFFTYHAESTILPQWRTPESSNGIVFFAQGYLMGFWILCAILLGMGGLIRERASGVSSFTLALPVSRTRLAAVRIALGVLQAISLAVVPWILIFFITRVVSNPVPISLAQAGFYLSLLISGGLIYFALAVLISSVIEGEYTAPAVAYGLTIFTVVLFGSVGWLRPYVDIWRFMGGDNHLDKHTFLLVGPFPLFGAVACVFVAAVMLLASTWIIQEREF
jgi:ABC-2 type transport system permease protein